MRKMFGKLKNRYRAAEPRMKSSSQHGTSVAQPDSRQRNMKLALFLASSALSMAALSTFDYFYSAAILRNSKSGAKASSCVVPDPVLHHALKPNCASVAGWGWDKYDYLTSSLGFRDEEIREVPLVDARPRILVLGNSFTEGPTAWHRSYVGRIADRFSSQYDFLNGAVFSYSPSIYPIVTGKVLAAGYDIDEVIAFIDISDVQGEAAFYRDVTSGGVTGPARRRRNTSWYASWRFRIGRNLLITEDLVEFCERLLVGSGYPHLTTGLSIRGDVLDGEESAWTYRKVNESDPFPDGYAPLGVEGGIAKETRKMTLLWQRLEEQNIPISVVVYPWPAQVVHDIADSRQVRIWREWCEGKCKRFISLFPAFLTVKDQCPSIQPGCWYEKLFVFGDFHYSDAGNALVADVVIKSLSEYPPLKRRAASIGGN